MATASPDAVTSNPQDESPASVGFRIGLWACLWVVVLTTFFLYVWLRVNPAFVYHAYWVQPAASRGVPVFRFDAVFFQDILRPPGGPMECVAAFLSQYLQFPWLGAAIISLLAAVLCLEAFVLIRAFAGASPGLLHLVPAPMLLGIYAWYFDPLAIGLSLAVALAFVCLYVHLVQRAIPVRLLVFLVLLVPLHYAVAGACLAYVLLCVLFELTVSRRAALATAMVVLGAAVPFCMGQFLFRVSPAESLGQMLPFHGLRSAGQSARPLMVKRSVLEAALFAFYPLAVLAAGLARRTGRRMRLAGAVSFAVLTVVVCAVHDGQLKTEIAVDYYASRRMWPEVLARGRKVPYGSYEYLFVNCAVNRALYHTGRLADDMFLYDQDPVGHMLCQDTLGTLMLRDRGWVMQAELLAELGCMNEAEHLAFEAMQSLGNHPRLLELAAYCDLAKGRTEAARILLGAMSGDPVYGGRARGLLSRMDKDPLLSDEPRLQRMRECRAQVDVAGWQSVEDALKALLAQNSRNRMAFEYLMGRYLIYGRLDDVVRELGRLDGMGYERIPRHYEEALLLYEAETRRSIDLGERIVAAETRERFEGFRRVLARNVGRPLPAQIDALSDYADTYMFYYCLLLPARRTQ